MIRKAFMMQVHAGHETEYERRHNPIWPELEAVLHQHGVHNYSIYLEPESRRLFAYCEIESEDRWNAIAQTTAARKWWAYMRDLMPSHPDNSPVAAPLREVFPID